MNLLSSEGATLANAQPYVGGQAVIEGVLMRSPWSACVVVRRPDGQLVLQTLSATAGIKGTARKWFGLRGIATLVESLRLGYRALQFSAEQQDPSLAEGKGSSSSGAMWLSMLFAVGLFIAAPQGLVVLANRVFGFSLTVQSPLFHLWVGVAKLSILLTYLFAISRIKEVQRVFQYHGAEHKTIFAYEKGLELNVENARQQSTLHPRCGTTFLIVVIFISVVLGSLVVPLLVPRNAGAWTQPLTFMIRLALLPFIAALAYEFQRFSAKYCTTGPMQVLLWPGYLVQKITTREPDDTQLETAVAAMKAAICIEYDARTDYKVQAFADLSGLLGGLPKPLKSAA